MPINDKPAKALDASLLRDARMALRIIERFTRGNVRIQQGALLSRRHLDERAVQRRKLMIHLRKLYNV